MLVQPRQEDANHRSGTARSFSVAHHLRVDASLLAIIKLHSFAWMIESSAGYP